MTTNYGEYVPSTVVDASATSDVERIAAPARAAARGRPTVLTSADFARDVLAPFVTTRLALVFIGLLAQFYISPLMTENLTGHPIAANLRLPSALWLMWQRFDSNYYTFIAHHSYYLASTLHSRSDWVFFPLFPWVFSPLGRLLGGNSTAYAIAGIAVSNLAALVASTYLYLLVRREFGRQTAVRSVLIMLLFPMSFYLSAVSSESTLLACALASLYYARERRWLLAGLCGGLAALARLQGVLLLVPLSWELWQVLSNTYAPLPARSRWRLWVLSRLWGPWFALRKIGTWGALLSLSLVPCGTLVFVAYAAIHTGNPLASFQNEALWGRHLSAPWTTLATSLLNPTPADPHDWNFWLLNNVAALGFLGVVVWAFIRLPVIYAFYALTAVLAPLASGSMQSLGRYYVVVFPAFILLALWSGHTTSPERSAGLLALFASLQALFMVFFVLGLHSVV